MTYGHEVDDRQHEAPGPKPQVARQQSTDRITNQLEGERAKELPDKCGRRQAPQEPLGLHADGLHDEGALDGNEVEGHHPQ